MSEGKTTKKVLDFANAQSQFPPPGEPCPSGPPWTEVVEKYKIQLINIDSKTEGIPEAGTKERGSCHVYLPTFG
ncbi:MAG: hypothetical protein AAF443_08830, partial [Chlamydiota bacterium]